MTRPSGRLDITSANRDAIIEASLERVKPFGGFRVVPPGQHRGRVPGVAPPGQHRRALVALAASTVAIVR